MAQIYIPNRSSLHCPDFTLQCLSRIITTNEGWNYNTYITILELHWLKLQYGNYIERNYIEPFTLLWAKIRFDVISHFINVKLHWLTVILEGGSLLCKADGWKSKTSPNLICIGMWALIDMKKRKRLSCHKCFYSHKCFSFLLVRHTAQERLLFSFRVYCKKHDPPKREDQIALLLLLLLLLPSAPGPPC